MRIGKSLKLLITTANVVLAGLIAGTMFGIWLGYNPKDLTVSAYVEQHQNAVRALNVTMPLLGAICIAVTIVHAIVARSNRAKLSLLVPAVVLFIIAGIVTRFVNQPINATVMKWQPASAPSGWEASRDLWWRWHIIRTISGVTGFVCIATACSIGDRRSINEPANAAHGVATS